MSIKSFLLTLFCAFFSLSALSDDNLNITKKQKISSQDKPDVVIVGQISLKTTSNKHLLVSSGIYKNPLPKGYKSFVQITDFDTQKQQKWNFYSRNIEVIEYNAAINRVYIYFKYETDVYGWIDLSIGYTNLKFTMFEDDEL